MNMTDMKPKLHWIRPLAWGVAGSLLLLPLVAMRFTDEVQWTAGDFLFAALLIGGVGVALELAVRKTGNWFYRCGALLGLGAGFLLIWSNAAVGYIGSEDNPYNLAFLGVVAIAFAGAAIARFRARGMAWAMASAGLAHAIAGTLGFPQDTRTGPITLVFLALWLGSAWLFQRAAVRES